MKKQPRGKSADHQSLLSQAQEDAQREWIKLSYQLCGAITWTKLRNSEEVINQFILVKWVTGHWRWYAAVRKEDSSRVQHRGQLVVRLIAIKYNERLLCYLFSYINLLMSDLWLDLDIWSRPQFQGWCIAFIPYTSYLMLVGRNRNHYYYLLLILFNIGFRSY